MPENHGVKPGNGHKKGILKRKVEKTKTWYNDFSKKYPDGLPCPKLATEKSLINVKPQVYFKEQGFRHVSKKPRSSREIYERLELIKILPQLLCDPCLIVETNRLPKFVSIISKHNNRNVVVVLIIIWNLAYFHSIFYKESDPCNIF